MNLENGLHLESPAILVPWSLNRWQLRNLLPNPEQAHKVTARYIVLHDIVSLGGLTHDLGLHFGVFGKLAKFEYFRRSGPGPEDSYREFQKHLERTFGLPTQREPGTEGFDRCIWKLNGAEIMHELIMRFGPEEHVWIEREPRYFGS